MKYYYIKQTAILVIVFLIFFSRSANSQEPSPTQQTILLTLKVQSWQIEDVIEIKYPKAVSNTDIREDLKALAKAHGWVYSERCFEVTYENGNKIGRQCGKFSEKSRFAINFKINFQEIQEQFPNFETIILDIIVHNGLSYQGTFSYSDAINLNKDLPLDQNWQDHFQFQKTGTGMSSYQIRYAFHPIHSPESHYLPMLNVSISFSNTWLLKIVLLLLPMVFLPSATLYLFLRQGISENKKGKIRLSPFRIIVIKIQQDLRKIVDMISILC